MQKRRAARNRMDIVSQKKVAKNTLFLYTRMFVGIALTLFISRIVLNALGANDLGLYSVVAGVVSVMIFANTSLSISSSRFITYELGKGDYESVRMVFNQSFFIHAVFSFLFLFVAETIGLWIVNHLLNIPHTRLYACNVIYQIAVFIGFINITRVSLNALLIAYEHMNVYAVIGIGEKIIALIIAYITLCYEGDRLIAYGFLTLLEAIAIYVLYWFYCRRNFSCVCKLTCKYDLTKVSQMVMFSIWSFLGSIVVVIKQHGINLLMNIFYGPIVNAANALAMQVYGAVTGFVTNYTMALNPQVTKLYAQGNLNDMRSLFLRGCKFSFFLLLLISYPVLFETHFLLELWLGDIPPFTVVFSRLLTVLMMVEVFNHSIGGAIRATGNIKSYMIVTSCILICCLPITFVIYKFGGEPYMAYIVVIILSVFAVLSRLRSVSDIIQCPVLVFLFKIVVPCIMTGALALIAPLFIHYGFNEGWLRLILTTIIGTLFSIVCIYLLGCTIEERRIIRHQSKKVMQKLYAKIH